MHNKASRSPNIYCKLIFQNWTFCSHHAGMNLSSLASKLTQTPEYLMRVSAAMCSCKKYSCGSREGGGGWGGGGGPRQRCSAEFSREILLWAWESVAGLTPDSVVRGWRERGRLGGSQTWLSCKFLSGTLLNLMLTSFSLFFFFLSFFLLHFLSYLIVIGE